MNLAFKLVSSCLTMAGSVVAAPPPCVSGTLASYIALGATGCTLDGNRFFNFTYTGSSTGGAPTITASQILVMPAFLAPETAQFKISAPWRAGSGQTQTSAIRYTVSLGPAGASKEQLDLMLDGSSVGTHGRATVGESSNVGQLLVYKQCGGTGCQSKLDDSLTFSPVKTMVIRNQVSVTKAALSGFSAALNRCYLCP